MNMGKDQDLLFLSLHYVERSDAVWQADHSQESSCAEVSPVACPFSSLGESQE